MEPKHFLPTLITRQSRSRLAPRQSGYVLIQDLAQIMRRVLLLTLLVSGLSLTGCDSLQKKHDNPVLSAAPRRVDPDKIDETKIAMAGNKPSKSKTKEDDGSNIEQVRAELGKKNPWDDWKDDTTIFNSQVAAVVNGVPILNGDVLDRFAGYLISMRENMQKAASDPKMLPPGQPVPGPEAYNNLRYQLIQMGINQHIQKKLLVERLRSGLKAEQVKLMENHIDEQFAKEIEKLKKEHKVTNKHELELELNKKGTTLKFVKDNFALEQLAGECIAIKADKADPIERPDLLAYYQTHTDEFNVPAKVKWQQIQVSIAGAMTKDDKKAARKKLDEAIAELDKGVPFEDVAKTYSDGPHAKEGGSRDWLEAGNLADTKLETKLFALPVNEISEIHEGPTSFSVVRVTEKQAAGRQPFEDVQREISRIIENEQRANRPKKFLRELYSSAVIETQYTLNLIPEE